LLIPMKAGDRAKTDQRDAAMLAKLYRSSELTTVWAPDAAHEAMRDLVRARAQAMRVLGNISKASCCDMGASMPASRAGL
jgi:transposase